MSALGKPIFQFTPLREGRPAHSFQRVILLSFQFTPLREGRPFIFSSSLSFSYFNSRPSARGDLRGRGACAPCRQISIHAPPRGATAMPASSYFTGMISIHAPPRGATSRRPSSHRRDSDFNSRPSARGDELSAFFVPEKRYFNSRPSARGDSACRLCRQSDSISIHAPPRGATGCARWL